MIAAGIDIGSNSVRLLIAEVDENKIKKIIYEDRQITRLAENINLTGKLSEEAIKRTLNALFSFNEQLKKHKVENIKAVATSAVREASNKDEFLKQTKDFVFDIEVIDGETESKLTFCGVKAGFDVEDHKSLLLDIGGGSTEFVYYNGREITLNKSISYGVVKLAEMFNFIHPVDDETIVKFNKLVQNEIIHPVRLSDDVEIFLATAGTPTTLAAIHLEMETYKPEIINGYRLKFNEIQDIFESLRKLNSNERLKIKGMEKGREDLIIPGILIILSIMKRLNIDEMIVCDYGLREGVTIAAAL